MGEVLFSKFKTELASACFPVLGNHVPRLEKLQRRRTKWKGLGAGGGRLQNLCDHTQKAGLP